MTCQDANDRVTEMLDTKSLLLRKKPRETEVVMGNLEFCRSGGGSSCGGGSSYSSSSAGRVVVVVAVTAVPDGGSRSGWGRGRGHPSSSKYSQSITLCKMLHEEEVIRFNRCTPNPKTR